MIGLAALLLAAGPAPADSPRAFLTRLYRRYESGDITPIPPDSSLYAPELVREMRLNSRLHPNEVGVIDYDPICQCQDMAELKAAIGPIAATGAGQAQAKVTIRFGHDPERRNLVLKLLRTPSGWRIADIATREQPSLLGDLRRDNAQLMRKKRR